MMLAAAQAHAFDFSDNSVALTYGPTYKEPGIPQNKTNHGTDISKFTLTFQHFDVWKYGTNFINIDALFSNAHDPAANSTNGAVEVYALYRGNLSGNALTNSTMFTFGPVKDVRAEVGIDFNTKNTTFAPEKKLIVAGPNFSFDVPGFLNVGLHVAHEWNNNGIVGKDVNFAPTFEMEIVWMQPLSFTAEIRRVLQPDRAQRKGRFRQPDRDGNPHSAPARAGRRQTDHGQAELPRFLCRLPILVQQVRQRPQSARQFRVGRGNRVRGNGDPLLICLAA
jgi:hypothetical protein